jgi:hypothetical protein
VDGGRGKEGDGAMEKDGGRETERADRRKVVIYSNMIPFNAPGVGRVASHLDLTYITTRKKIN